MERTMRSVITILAAIAMLSMAGAAADTILSIQPQDIKVSNTGDTATATIKIDTNKSLGAVDVWLTYNKTVVEVASVADGNMGTLVLGINNTNGTTRMEWFSVTGKTGSLDFAKVTFKAVGAAGQTSDLTLTVREIADIDGNVTENTVQNGKFSISAPVANETIVLAPAKATNNISESHTVVSTVKDAAGKPMASREVTFKILSGPNAPKTGNGTTNVGGTASFTYTSNGKNGTDNIQASFMNDKQQTIMSNIVEKTWISGTGPTPGPTTPEPTTPKPTTPGPTIPEFPTIIIPATGIMALVLLLSRRREE